MIPGSELTGVQGRTKYSRPLYPASRLNVTGIILFFRRCVEMISSRTVSRSPSQAEFEVVIMIAVVPEELHGVRLCQEARESACSAENEVGPSET
jgi:hypothetical protein